MAQLKKIQLFQRFSPKNIMQAEYFIPEFFRYRNILWQDRLPYPASAAFRH